MNIGNNKSLFRFELENVTETEDLLDEAPCSKNETRLGQWVLEAITQKSINPDPGNH